MIYILRVTITYVNTKGENTLVTSNRNASIQMKQIILTRVSHILWRRPLCMSYGNMNLNITFFMYYMSSNAPY